MALSMHEVPGDGDFGSGGKEGDPEQSALGVLPQPSRISHRSVWPFGDAVEDASTNTSNDGLRS